jgi:hypothetical protein
MSMFEPRYGATSPEAEDGGKPGLTLRIYRCPGAARMTWALEVPTEPGLKLLATARWPQERPVLCLQVRSLPASYALEKEVALVACQRAGPLVTLVAARSLERRSQIHFMEDGSGKAWWNTRSTTLGLRPSIRVPTRRPPGGGVVPIQIDTRERRPYSFAGRAVTTVRLRLDVGDYATLTARGLAAAERKSVADFAQSVVKGTLPHVMDELATLPRGAVVVEGRYGNLLSVQYVAPGFLINLVAVLSIRYPAVQIVFADTRTLAEEWTYRWLAAARAELGAHPEIG